MKKKRKLGGILLIIIAIIIMQLPMSEADAATSASEFILDGKILVSYKGTEKDVSIPSTVETVGKGAFQDNITIESVTIPYSVKRMKAFVFWGCAKLSKVSLGSGLSEVGDYVFNNCKGLKSVTIPPNIHSIGIKSFADCVNLTDIVIPQEVTFIHESAFDGCTKLVIHADEGTYAWKYAQSFYERQKEMPEYEDVTDYNPDNLPQKPEGSEEEEVVPPDMKILGTTTVVANHAVVFVDNKYQKVYGGTPTPELDNDTKEYPVYDQNGKLMKHSIVDKETVADQAYYQSNQLSKVSLSDQVREIGQFAFARSSISEISLSEGLNNICYGAFYHCDNLAEVHLPSTVMNVEPKAFEHTKWVWDFLEGKGEEGDDFLISGGVLVAYRGKNPAVVIPEGVRVIAAEAFAGHKEISTVKFPDSLLVIGEDAFVGCDSLSSILWGKKLKQIKDRAFADCNIGSITIPESVLEMGLFAFPDLTRISYEGKRPATTYEVSAQRLSNENYRPCQPENELPGVTVSGLSNCVAHLDGAARRYTLKASESQKHPDMMQAFIRNLHMDFPEDGQILELELYDNSRVPITKLGKQPLTVTIPLNGSMLDKKIMVVVLDRNGQLEILPAQKVRLDGTEAIRFQTNYVSDVAIFSNGDDDSEIIEVKTTLSEMSGPPSSRILETAVRTRKYDKLIIGCFLMAIGFFLLAKKVK